MATNNAPATSRQTKHELSTNRVIMIAASVTFVVVVISVIIGRNLVGQLVLNGKVLSKKTAAETQLHHNLETVEALHTNHAKLGPLNDVIMHALPTKPDFSLVSGLLENIAGQSGVSLRSATPGTGTGVAAPALSAGGAPAPVVSTTGPGGSQEPQSYGFAISVSGNYTNLILFLKNLELSARPLRVTDITITGAGPAINADLKLSTYHQAEASIEPRMETIK